MRSGPGSVILIALIGGLSACGPKPKEAAQPAAAPPDPGGLVQVGSIRIRQADLDYQMKERHAGRDDEATRRKALDELVSRARQVQAALDAGLDQDPAVRAEFARILTNQFKAKAQPPHPQGGAAPAIPEARLRELYAAGESRFRANEKRQVAVLWLNPNGNPDREQQYTTKLTEARGWFFKNDLKDHPEQGFSVLSVDHSEHQASRYQGGVVGWLENSTRFDPWTHAVAEIAFSLKEPGEVSAVISRAEGVFLVRYMAQKPAVLQPFEAVAGELSRAEQQRLRELAETEFENALKARYPAQRLPGGDRDAP